MPINRLFDRFDQELFVGNLVALATNTGIYLGRVTQLREYNSVQVRLSNGRLMTYDKPNKRMIKLDDIQEYAESIDL